MDRNERGYATAVRSRSVIAALGGVVDIGDVATAFWGSDPEHAAAVTTLLGAMTGDDGPAQVELAYEHRVPPVPANPTSHTYDNARVWHRGNELIVRLTETTAGLRATPDRAWVGACEGDLRRPWQLLFHFAVTHLLAHRERFVLHAAAVVAPDRADAHVVLGETGQGKSTLALGALTAGWRLLADDLVIVRSGAAGLEVQGIPRRLAVPSDLGPVDVALQPLPGDQRGRAEIGAEHLTRGWFPVAGVVVVAHGTSADGEVGRLAGDETMFRALGAFSSVTDPHLLAAYFPVAASLCRLPRWQLRHGAHRSTRLEVARTLLAQLTSG
jgi:hypothetical protein